MRITPETVLNGALGVCGGLGSLATAAGCGGAGCSLCFGCIWAPALLVAAALVNRRKRARDEEKSDGMA